MHHTGSTQSYHTGPTQSYVCLSLPVPVPYVCLYPYAYLELQSNFQPKVGGRVAGAWLVHVDVAMEGSLPPPPRSKPDARS